MPVYLQDHPGEKIVVFSYFRKTLGYLAERLNHLGIENQVLTGGMPGTKQGVIDKFRDDGSVRVLLSSEVASEGVDLQFCRLLINYDLPWNPMRIEQRIGRLDRIGQKADKISIWNLCHADTIDERILKRLFERLNIFERALGGMEAILGEEIKTLTNDLLKPGLTGAQQDERIEQTAMAVERNRQEQNDLEKQASHLIAHGGYILERVRAAHDFRKRITEEDLIIYVKDYLDRFCPGHVFHRIKPDERSFKICLPAKTAAGLDDFTREKKLYNQTRLATGDTIRSEFVNKISRHRSGNESISQFHPLIKFISDGLTKRNETFYPLVAVKIAARSSPRLPAGNYGL